MLEKQKKMKDHQLTLLLIFGIHAYTDTHKRTWTAVHIIVCEVSSAPSIYMA